MRKRTKWTIALIIVILLAGFGPWLTKRLSKKEAYETAEAAQSKINYSITRIGTTCFAVSIGKYADPVQSLTAAAKEINKRGYDIENAAAIKKDYGTYARETRGMFFFVKPKT